MSSIQQAEKEWNENTKPHPKKHRLSKYRETFLTHDFRKFKDAIALLEWTKTDLVITKLEKLPDSGRGAAIQLVDFLKSLADKYSFHIRLRVFPYTPDEPWPENEHILSLDELKSWYLKRGFKLFPAQDEFPWGWYPDAPEKWLKSRSEL